MQKHSVNRKKLDQENPENKKKTQNKKKHRLIKKKKNKGRQLVSEKIIQQSDKDAQRKKGNQLPIREGDNIGVQDFEGVAKSSEISQQMQDNDIVPTETKWPGLPGAALNCTSLLIIGHRKSGKSTLSRDLSNKETVLIDCDIGQNCGMECCMTLQTSDQEHRIWVGELTPLNNLPGYLQALAYLLGLYQQRHFTKRLIINTMGYLAGIGEVLLYQTYHIVKPEVVLLLTSVENSSRLDGSAAQRVMRNLQSGDYLQKLYLSQQMNRRDDPNPCSSIACTYLNHSARKKKRQCRFEGHLHYNGSPITNLRELLYAINAYKLLPKQVKLNCDIAEFDLKDIRIYRSAGSTLAMINADEMLDRRLVALGILLEEGLVEIFGLGYMHSGLIYTQREISLQVITGQVVGVVSEVLQFDKSFYQLSERDIIELELDFGRIPHLALISQALGSASVRNNPPKVPSGVPI